MKNKHDPYTQANTYILKRGQKCLYVGHRLSPGQLKQDSIMLVIRRLIESGLKLGLPMAEVVMVPQLGKCLQFDVVWGD